MFELTIAEVAKLLGAAMESATKPFPAVSIDSRTLQPGQCFMAIKGERFDGHDFIGDCLHQGAAVVIHSRDFDTSPWADRVFLQVPDTTAALQILGHYVRKKWGNPLIAITGSTGKTTTKEFTAALLSQKFRVFKSQGNLNNEIGVPLSLLQLSAEEKPAVLELGMSHAGEIRKLGKICAPDAALITNVAPVHLEFFSSLDEIAAAKAELLESLPSDGAFVFNADDPRLSQLAEEFSGKKVSFALETSANVRIPNFRFESLHSMDFEVRAFGQTFRAAVPFVGKHFLYNIAAAVAVSFAYQLSPQEMLAGISQLQPLAMRGRIFESEGITIWDDSYNSNPHALKVVLETIARLKGFRRKILVLGEMLELGLFSREFHREAGRALARIGADLVTTVGTNAAAIEEGARESGFTGQMAHFENSAQAAEFVVSEIQSGDFLLVKGSRGVQMDRVVQRIEEAQKV